MPRPPRGQPRAASPDYGESEGGRELTGKAFRESSGIAPESSARPVNVAFLQANHLLAEVLGVLEALAPAAGTSPTK